VVSIFIGATAVYWQEYFGVGIDIYNIVFHGLFIGWLDCRITNSILGVEWSIPIEVFWYFLVPFMLILCRNIWGHLGVLVMSLFVYMLSTKHPGILPVNAANAALAMHWTPIPYILAYALGLTAYRFRKYCNHSNGVGNLVLILLIVFMGIYVYKPEMIAKIFYDEFVFMSLITTVAILFGTNKSRFFNLMFCNSAIQLVGVVSYGVYLCHLPLLSLFLHYDLPEFGNPLLRFLYVAISSILVSTLTYHIFELRCTHVGKRFGNRVLTSTKP
jgi:peptidoglycan/LPS O-acetylase OafA/YrhL